MRIPILAIWLGIIGVSGVGVVAGGGEKIEAAHAKNTVFAGVVAEGFTTDGATVKLPEPRLRDGQPAEVQRAALREVAGSDRKLDEMLRDSVTAPYIIKVSDVKARGVTIRMVSLWFVLHADLTGIDPAREAAKTSGQPAEAGNMAFRTRILGPDEQRKAGIAPTPEPKAGSGPETWYAHVHGRLLDRIAFDATSRAQATRTDESIVVAARTDPAFDRVEAGNAANGWRPVAGGNDEARGDGKPYAGGVSYTRISRLAFQPGALLVEMHAAFAEPHEWFQGAPILRSKFSIIAQDQIRRLRRELKPRQK
ncbi:MAG: hypothetical protein ACYC61_02705 [Isosphaeraceae bacterium]